MKKFLLAAFLISLTQGLAAQNRLEENEYFFNLYNGLKLFVREDSAAKDVTTAIVFNCGAFMEDEQFDGMSFLFEKILAARVEVKLNLPVHSETSLEYVFLGVNTPASESSRVMEVIYQAAITPVDSVELQKAATVSNELYQELYATPQLLLDTAIGTVLWRENFSKRSFILHWSDSAIALLPQRMSTMTEQYFCPGNSLLIIDGNLNRKEVQVTAGKVFENWRKCTISLFTRFPGYNYKTVLLNTQVVAEGNPGEGPFFEVAFQGPPPFEGIKSNYCAMILSSVIENADSKLQRFFRDSCHLTSVYLRNDMTRFLSQLTFTASPDSNFLSKGIECFRSFLAGSLDTLIDSTQLETAKEAIISKINALKANNRSNAFLIAKYWQSISIDDYNTIEDSVRSIGTTDMQRFLDDYLRKRRYVAGLYLSPALRDSSGIDSVFTPTATDISAYRLHFLKNSGRFASAADDSVFNSLVQFLKINPEVNVKVHGICHETELQEIEDEELLKWVGSLDYFVMNPPSYAKKKKFRLDAYRSLLLIKKLLDAGIGKDRLLGTASRVRTPEAPEKYQAAIFYRLFN